MQWLAVAFGGALGAMARYGCTLLSTAWFGTRFPLATLFVNVLGSLLIGICYVLIVEKGIVAPHWRPVLMVAFLGSLTTFSTFSLDALLLWQNGQVNAALLFIVLNLVLSLGAVALAVAGTIKLVG